MQLSDSLRKEDKLKKGKTKKQRLALAIFKAAFEKFTITIEQADRLSRLLSEDKILKTRLNFLSIKFSNFIAK